MKRKTPFITLPPTISAKQTGQLQRLQFATRPYESQPSPDDGYHGKRFPGPLSARMSQASGWGSGTPISRRAVEEQHATLGERPEATEVTS